MSRSFANEVDLENAMKIEENESRGNMTDAEKLADLYHSSSRFHTVSRFRQE